MNKVYPGDIIREPVRGSMQKRVLKVGDVNAETDGGLVALADCVVVKRGPAYAMLAKKAADELFKAAEDQPRDEKGRFAAGSGSGGGKADHDRASGHGDKSGKDKAEEHRQAMLHHFAEEEKARLAGNTKASFDHYRAAQAHGNAAAAYRGGSKLASVAADVANHISASLK